MKRSIKTAGFAFYIITIVFGCSSSPDDNGIEKNKEAFLQNIKTTNATLTYQKEEWNLSGKVEYDPDKVVNYVPLISGVVERTYFSLGDKVAKGQNLLDIRSTELSNLHSEQLMLESEIKIAERELQTA